LPSKQSIGQLPPRIPVFIELKEYAQWFGRQEKFEARGFLPYLSYRLGTAIGQKLHAGTLQRSFERSRWLFIFDGLDEVPGDVKDDIAASIISFVDQVLVGCQADALCVCTSRPQGYSGQFKPLDATTLDLPPLSPSQALACAKPVLEIDRSKEQSLRYLQILSDAIKSPTIQEIMTTPLQSHIMAVVVRDGGRPPEKRWQLFDNFYEVIRKREANRQLANEKLAKLIQERQKLLKNLHNRLGFELHFRAETSRGAQTSLDRSELLRIVREVVIELQDDEVDETVDLLMEATTERLVLVNTPDTGGGRSI
jgi:hypothetical protein